MILFIIFLLLIIALPNILNILGITWLISKVIVYRYYIIAIVISAIVLLIFTNKDRLKWSYFRKKTERIISKTIRREFLNNPTITQRQIFDLVVKEWVPFAKKLYPNIKPKDLGIKLKVTPKGIEARMKESVLKEC